MNMIQTFNKIPNKELYDCRVTSLREILRYYNIIDESYSIFLISKCINFNWTEIIYNNIKFPLCGISNFFLEEEVARSCGIKMMKKSVNNHEELWKETKKNVDKDIPFIFLYDPKVLSNLNTDYVNKEKSILDFSYPSSGVIVGYEEENQTILYDGNLENKEFGINTYYAKDIYMSMCNSKGFISYKYMIYEFDIGKEESKEIIRNLDKIIIKSLIDTCELMLTRKIDEYCGLETKGNGVTGIESMYKYLEEFAYQMKSLEENEGIKATKKIVYLKIYIFRMAILKGSNTCFRGEFSESLSYVMNKYNMNYLFDSVDNFENLAKLYRGLVRKLNSALKAEEKFHLAILKVSEQFKNIYELEKKSFEILKKVLLENNMGSV